MTKYTMIRGKRWIAVSLCIPILLIAGAILAWQSISPSLVLAQAENGITSPAPNSVVTGTVLITGTASTNDFDYYTLEFKEAQADDDSYNYFDGAEQEVVNGLLGVWDTTEVAPGEYTLRLRAVRIDGNYEEDIVANLRVMEPAASASEAITATPITATVDATATVAPTGTATPPPPTQTPPPPTPTLTPTPTPAAQQAEDTQGTEVAQESVSVAEEGTAVSMASVEQAVPSGPISVTLIGADDVDALTSFLRTTLAAYNLGAGTLTGTIGALPVDFPIDFTVPSTATVVGGVVYTGERGGSRIYLGAEGAAEDLVEVLRQQFMDQGFISPPAEQRQGLHQVFLPTERPIPSLICSPDGDYILTLGTLAIAGDAESVRLDANPIEGARSPCEAQPAEREPSTFGMLPQLLPPPETEVQASGGTSGGNFVSAEAELVSDLTAAELGEHYETQLEESGWEQVDQSGAEALIWSAWTFVDDEDNAWAATFYIVRQGAEEDNYLATLRAERQQ